MGARVRDANGNAGFVTKVGPEGVTVQFDDGRIGEMESNAIEIINRPSRARLIKPLPLVEDPKGWADAFLAWAKEQQGAVTAAGEPLVGGNPPVSFLAVVDAIDKGAVVSLVALMLNEAGDGLRAYERRDGGWIEAPDFVRDLMGVTPPPVVELDRETLLSVVSEMDSYDLKKAASG